MRSISMNCFVFLEICPKNINERKRNSRNILESKAVVSFSDGSGYFCLVVAPRRLRRNMNLLTENGKLLLKKSDRKNKT
jgi:hypothetical protein